MKGACARAGALVLAGALAGCVGDRSSMASSGSAAVVLPGIQYQILRAGPPGGPRPTRADAVDIRYVGRLTNGDIFSTSADNGSGTSSFDVQRVIPGFMAAIQLMRPAIGGGSRFLPTSLTGRRGGATPRQSRH